MNQLYPFTFKPVYKEKIWGGNYFKKIEGLTDAPSDKTGEAWVLSGLEEDSTLISNGFLEGNPLCELVEIYMDDIVGEKVYSKFGNHFPLLFKIIDANGKLSIQVHPDDKTAERLHDAPNGKSEMWYIMHADPEAWIINGFSKKISKDEYLNHLNNNKLNNIINYVNVNKGDVFFIPGGRIHAVGKGIVFAEIQQASDYTYRIYDWDRVNESGKKRELHTKLATEAMNYEAPSSFKTNYRSIINGESTLISEEAFHTSMLWLNHPLKRDFSNSGSFVAYLCLEGCFDIICNNVKTTVKAGNAALVPAEIPEFVISPSGEIKILEVYLK